MFRSVPVPTPPVAARLALVAALGLLGLLPGAAGAADPVALLAWLALSAPALGYACGAALARAGAGARIGADPFTLAVPGLWCFALVWADLTSPRDLAHPVGAGLVVLGLFLLGLGPGRRYWRPALGAGLLLSLSLLLALIPQLGGERFARHAPAVAGRLQDASPLALVLESAGWDWSHAQPDVYRRSGVEWYPRTPFRASLAGPVVLLVGCASSVVFRRRAADR